VDLKKQAGKINSWYAINKPLRLLYPFDTQGLSTIVDFNLLRSYSGGQYLFFMSNDTAS